MKKTTIQLGLIICLLAVSFALAQEANAATYYIAPNGSDSNSGSTNSPWKTFNYAMKILRPGDTLILKDGTYTNSTTGTLLWYSSKGAPSGTSGNPITIKALNDGQAFVDGQDSNRPFHILGDDTNRIHDINIEGIKFGNSNTDCLSIYKADRINVKRVSAFDADYDTNTAVIIVNRSTYVLLEDVATWGDGRTHYDIYESDYITIRRCWWDWGDHSGVGGSSSWGMQIYGSDNSIVENCVGRTASAKSPSGIAIWANTYNLSANNNKIYGNVVYNMNIAYWVGSAKYNIWGNEFHHNVSISNKESFLQRGDDDLVVRNLVVTGNTVANNYVLEDMSDGEILNPDFVTSGTMKHSMLINSASGGLYIDTTGTFGSFTNTYNNYYNNMEPNWKGGAYRGTGEKTINPAYNIALYGKGAYLMIPSALKGQGESGEDIGAEVLYRYENGVLTTAPLWPWPMEDRIFAETGISVTWEANGGLWKTLNGVYSGSPPSPPTFDYALSNSGNVSVSQGSSVSNTIAASLVSGSTQSVSYSASGLPSGATASFSPASCMPDCSTTLTINISASTPTGTYTITVSGSGGGITKTTGFNLTVNSSSPPPSQNSITSLKTNTAITIDGKLLENGWNQANYVTFSNASRSDNLVNVYTLYDDNNLYFAYQVTDSNLETLNNNAFWNEDGAEIYLDTQNNKTTSMDSNDFDFFVNINDLSSRGGINTKTVTNQNGYIMEIAIPWAAINTTPSPNMTMGLLLANNDRDNGQIRQFDWLNITATGSYSRPNLWGNLILSSQTITSPLKSDLNQDGAVNALDWSMMNLKWNTADPQADLNNDGVVNTLDWSIMNSNWTG